MLFACEYFDKVFSKVFLRNLFFFQKTEILVNFQLMERYYHRKMIIPVLQVLSNEII